MVRRAADIARDPAVVVLNPDDEVTPGTFAAWLDRRQAGEPVDPGISAAATIAVFWRGVTPVAIATRGVLRRSSAPPQPVGTL